MLMPRRKAISRWDWPPGTTSYSQFPKLSRAQAPLIDEMLKEIGIEPGKIGQIASNVIAPLSAKKVKPDENEP